MSPSACWPSAGWACGVAHLRGGASIGLLLAVGGAALGLGVSVGGFAVGSIAIGGAAVGFVYAIGGGAFGPAVIDARELRRRADRVWRAGGSRRVRFRRFSPVNHE